MVGKEEAFGVTPEQVRQFLTRNITDSFASMLQDPPHELLVARDVAIGFAFARGGNKKKGAHPFEDALGATLQEIPITEGDGSTTHATMLRAIDADGISRSRRPDVAARIFVNAALQSVLPLQQALLAGHEAVIRYDRQVPITPDEQDALERVMFMNAPGSNMGLAAVGVEGQYNPVEETFFGEVVTSGDCMAIIFTLHAPEKGTLTPYEITRQARTDSAAVDPTGATYIAEYFGNETVNPRISEQGHTIPLALPKGSVIVLCSDGLPTELSDGSSLTSFNTMAHIIQEGKAHQQNAQQIAETISQETQTQAVRRGMDEELDDRSITVIMIG